jgi:hypothetical protein
VSTWAWSNYSGGLPECLPSPADHEIGYRSITMCVGCGPSIAKCRSWIKIEARKALFLGASAGNPLAHEVYLIRAPLDGPLPSTGGILSPVAFGTRQIGFDFNRRIVTWAR